MSDTLGITEPDENNRFAKLQHQLDKKRQEVSEANITPERKQEIDSIAKEMQEAEGAWNNAKAGGKYLVDMLTHPSEWSTQGIVSQLAPETILGFGAGGIAAKAASTLGKRLAIGAGVGAAENMALGSGYNYLAERGEGKTHDEAKKTLQQGIVLDAAVGGLFGLAGAGVMHHSLSRALKKDTDLKMTRSVDDVENVHKKVDYDDMQISMMLNQGKEVSPEVSGANILVKLKNTIEDGTLSEREVYEKLGEYGLNGYFRITAFKAYQKGDASILGEWMNEQMGRFQKLETTGATPQNPISDIIKTERDLTTIHRNEVTNKHKQEFNKALGDLGENELPTNTPKDNVENAKQDNTSANKETSNQEQSVGGQIKGENFVASEPSKTYYPENATIDIDEALRNEHLKNDNPVVASIAWLYERHPEMFKSKADVYRTIQAVKENPDLITSGKSADSVMFAKKLNDEKMGDMVISRGDENKIIHANKKRLKNKSEISGRDPHTLYTPVKQAGELSNLRSGANAHSNISEASNTIIPHPNENININNLKANDNISFHAKIFNPKTRNFDLVPINSKVIKTKDGFTYAVVKDKHGFTALDIKSGARIAAAKNANELSKTIDDFNAKWGKEYFEFSSKHTLDLDNAKRNNASPELIKQIDEEFSAIKDKYALTKDGWGNPTIKFADFLKKNGIEQNTIYAKGGDNLAAGLISGVEEDENGNLSINPAKFIAGLGGYTVAKKLLQNPKVQAELKDAIAQQLYRLERKAESGDMLAQNILGTNYLFIDPNLPKGRYMKGAFSDTATKQVMGEIDDRKAKFILKTNEKRANLGDILSHNELFKKYPEFKNIPTHIKIDKKAQSSGRYRSKTNQIEIIAKDINEAKTTLLHEIQHAIQKKENWARGGNSGMFTSQLRNMHRHEMAELEKKIRPTVNELRDKLQKGEISWEQFIQMKDALPENKIIEALRKEDLVAIRSPYQAYRNLHGEQMARATEYRANMSPEQRIKESYTDTLKRVEGEAPGPIVKYRDNMAMSEALENRYLDKNGLVNEKILMQNSEDLPKQITSFKEWKAMFKIDKNGKSYIQTPINKLYANPETSYKHLVDNTYKKDRRKIGGAFRRVFEDPLFIVRQQYAQSKTPFRKNGGLTSSLKSTKSATAHLRDDKSIAQSIVFYKPFKTPNGNLHLAGFAIDKNGKLLNTTFYEYSHLGKIAKLIKAKKADVLYDKFVGSQKVSEQIAKQKRTKDIINHIENSPRKGRDLPQIQPKDLNEEVLGYLQKSKRKVIVERISEPFKKALGDKFGFKFVDDIKRTISGDSINHTLKRHSSNDIELSRNGLPVSLEDIKQYPSIVQQADVLTLGQTNSKQPAIISGKQINGHYVIVEEVQTKQNELAFKTMYKVKGNLAENKMFRQSEASPFRVMSTATTTPLSNSNTIPNHPQKVKPADLTGNKLKGEYIKQKLESDTPHSMLYEADDIFVKDGKVNLNLDIKDKRILKYLKDNGFKSDGGKISAKATDEAIEIASKAKNMAYKKRVDEITKKMLEC